MPMPIASTPDSAFQCTQNSRTPECEYMVRLVFYGELNHLNGTLAHFPGLAGPLRVEGPGSLRDGPWGIAKGIALICIHL